MRARALLIPLIALTLVAAGCGDDDDEGAGDTSTTAEDGGGGGDLSGDLVLMSAGEQNEVAAYQEIFDELINSEVGYNVEVEQVGTFEEQFLIRANAGTLEVAAVPQPGSIPSLAEEGKIVALEDLGVDIAALSELVGESAMEFGAYEGKHYGVPTNINLKSMVWYAKDDFDEAGYQVPETWDDLVALSEQIVADGGTPWCVGFNSDGSAGWPATDWMEDIMLRTAGPDVYQQWVKHEIPFNDPSVKAAAERFGEIMFGEGFVAGGAASTADILFADAPKPLFTEPTPGCYLHRQASFIAAQFADAAEPSPQAGVDYDWFTLPPIDQPGILYGGELTVIGPAADPELAKDFVERFVAQDVQCEMAGVPASSRISPNVNVGPDCYPDDLLADASEILTKALRENTGGFDASDLMPKEVGQGTFWSGMLEYMKSGPDALDGILQDIEDSWP
jgi:alpha-glucoside transport system substrate-binding protein